MLFDLRSRGRRRTVQSVYLMLAVLMGGGLVLFGVGAGNGFGGLLDAFKGNGGGNGAAKQTISQAEKTAQRATVLRPNDPSAWASLAQVRFDSAGQVGNFDPNTLTYTASGHAELTSATQAWKRYLQLTKAPDWQLADLVATRVARAGDFATAAAAWEIVTAANPTTPRVFECLAAASYAAKEVRKGDLASAKAISLAPKLQQTQLKSVLAQAKSSPSVTNQC
jgi:Flp pilus assembly protein TadD